MGTNDDGTHIPNLVNFMFHVLNLISQSNSSRFIQTHSGEVTVHKKDTVRM